MAHAFRSTTTRLLALAVGLALLAVWVVPARHASATGSNGIYLSLRPDRSGAALLSGQVVSGNIFVYWSKSVSPTDTSGYNRVDFSVDGIGYRSELVVPYDLGGTFDNGTAGAFSTASLSTGTHRIGANVRGTNGKWTSFSGTFVVGTPTSTSTTSTTAAPATTTSTTAAPTTTTTAAPTTTTTVAPVPVPATSVATKVPRFAASSFWYQQLPSNVLLNALSATYVSAFNAQWKQYYNNVGINTTKYAPPIFVASSSTPTQKVRVWDCQNKGYLDAGLQSQLSAVPVPPGTQPSSGTDGELVISQPSTDTVWEMWQARWATDGVLEACWGGKLGNVSATQGSYPFPYGTTATGLSEAGGLITPEELRAGHIDHALSVALVQTQQSLFSWPANRTDGGYVGTGYIPEGLRFRLDPTINVDALPITNTAKIVAKALQTYGMVVRDKSGSVTFYAENVYAETGTDPYPSLFGAPSYSVLNGIPWDRLQALPLNYGQP